MTNYSSRYQSIRQILRYRYFLLFLRLGIHTLRNSPRLRRILSRGIALSIALFILLSAWPTQEPFDRMVLASYRFLLVAVCIIAAILFLLWLGTPSGLLSTTANLIRGGLTNSVGEAPMLLSRHSDENDVEVLEFETYGIPSEKWEDVQTVIGSALNVHIVKLKQGKDNRHILLFAVPATRQLSDSIRWHQGMTSTKDFELILGESLLGPVTLDLNSIPHILIGGSTGSGKTIELRSLLVQCIEKGADVVIADFKGVDFSRAWRQHCEVIIEEDTLIHRLSEIIEELKRRKSLYRSVDCANLKEYNRLGNNMNHIVIACDEISELLDKTGASKDRKDKIATMESSLATIARQGRAFGINLILATQRPDANILSGQIKNNLDCRICGRADNILSQIILDSVDAADLIPKDVPGRFLMMDGTVLQGYYLDDSYFEEESM